MKFAQTIFLISIFLLASSLPVPADPVTSPAPEGMAAIPGGCFMMGTDKIFWYKPDEWDNVRERPAHKVCLDPFLMDRTEATQKQWEKVMGHHNSIYRGPDLPVQEVSWEAARDFCLKQGKRLPTEAEWEYAARAGTQGTNFWGEGIDDDYLWWVGNSARTPHPVATRKPNPWGLYDMTGNVWEWVKDWYEEDYYKKSPVNNPRGPEKRQSWRVIRGASWVEEEIDIRITIRMRGLADPTEDFWVGARCAQNAPKTKN